MIASDLKHVEDQLAVTPCLQKALSEGTPVHLSAGQLVVLYPEDAYAPKLAAGKPSPVKKIVVKVAV